MPRGGRRAGTTGRAYSNRSDLNEARVLPVQAPTGQAYGEAKQQMDAQRAVPMAAPPRPRVPPTPLDAESQRPMEPVTAGAPVGPGPGPEAISALGLGGDEIDELRVLYQRFPQFDELRQIIEEFEEGGF